MLHAVLLHFSVTRGHFAVCSHDFGEDLYIYGQYTDTYELIRPKVKDVNGELLRCLLVCTSTARQGSVAGIDG